MGKDYYSILGVSKNASLDDIKKAYKKLALKYHPDRNTESNKEKAQQKFVEINEAYEVLSDEQKKKIYDQFGEEGLKAGIDPNQAAQGGFSGFAPGGSGVNFGGPGFSSFHASDPFTVFEQFFGPGFRYSYGNLGRNPSSSSGNRNFRTFSGFNMPQEDNQYGDYEEDIFSSPYSRSSSYSKQPTAAVERTFACTLEEIYSGHNKRLRITSSIYNERGEATPQSKIIEIPVPSGAMTGSEFLVHGAGDVYPGKPAGDMIFVLEEKPHNYYKRDCNDIIYTAKITLAQALTGVKINLPTLDGQSVEVLIRDVIKPGYEKRISGRGMPIPKYPGHYGDLIVQFDILWPNRIDSKEDRTLLKKVLGKNQSN